MISRIGLHIIAADCRVAAADTTLHPVRRRRAQCKAILIADAAGLGDDSLALCVDTLGQHGESDPAFLQPHAQMELDDVIRILETALQSPAVVPDQLPVPK
jgi:hypothetical protein